MENDGPVTIDLRYNWRMCVPKRVAAEHLGL
jgi:hypothetical protein